MAGVVVDGDELVVHLTALERTASLHADVRVPRRAVQGVEVLDAPVDAVGGWKVVGSRLPGCFAVGTFDRDGHRCFAVVHRNAGQCVRVALAGARYDELVVGCADPESVAAALRLDR
jgi:hypothetical protein